MINVKVSVLVSRQMSWLMLLLHDKCQDCSCFKTNVKVSAIVVRQMSRLVFLFQDKCQGECSCFKTNVKVSILVSRQMSRLAFLFQVFLVPKRRKMKMFRCDRFFRACSLSV